MRALLLIALLGACSTPSRVPARPLGVRGNLAEAQRHEADARELEVQAASREVGAPTGPRYVCDDQGLADVALPGPGRTDVRAPCWSSERSAAERDRAAADRLRADARAHRARARSLMMAERASCAGLPPEALDDSPFAHRADIAAVSAELDGDRLVGARIRFGPVPRLTADWLQRTLACHHALAAAEGYDPTYMASCPVVLPGARTSVLDDPAGLTVVIRAEDPAAALVIYARAEALLDDQLDHDHDAR